MAKNATLEKLPNGNSLKWFLTDVRPHKTEMHQIRFLLGNLQRSPDALAGFSLRGPTCKEMENKEREGKEGRREGRVERSRRWMSSLSNY